MAIIKYGPHRLLNNDVGPNVLNGFKSGIKLEEMLGKEAFELGDIFGFLIPFSKPVSLFQAQVLERGCREP